MIPSALRRAVLALLGLAAVLALAAPGAALRGPAAAPRPPFDLAREGSPHALAGRHERTVVPGGYVDVHGPLAPHEARALEGYRDARGRRVVAPR